jgi:murein DD-endopeptidase MepM/ murein hydrolase activator NlpD
MERYSLIVVTDETKPIRRFDVPKQKFRRALQIAGVTAFVLAVGMVDYVRVRIDNAELGRLRAETTQQRERIARFDATVSEVEARLARLAEFERKVRTIANLPGQAATGGEDVEEVGGGGEGGDLEEGAAELLATDDETLMTEPATGTPVPRLAAPEAPAAPAAARAPGDDRVSLLRQEAERLGHVAAGQELSLGGLIGQLERKHHRLVSSPAIWPTKGWLTSRFGPRISPFTGLRQFHSGIDIAGAHGTEVIAPARGRVSFVGNKGPMGRTLVIDHGYGVRTHYGHNAEVTVRVGQEVERGEVIAKMGSSGRSTGPHLHYSVEVSGKAKNPLDFIFD